MEIIMTKHEKRPEPTGQVCVLAEHRTTGDEQILPVYDATVHVGLRTIIYDAAIHRVDANGEETIEVPLPRELRASAVIARCLMPVRLRGRELKAMRKIMKMTLVDLAKKLDERTAAETVSRWEAENQPMGSYVEKWLRLIICEELRDEAPGIAYHARKLRDLKLEDPWKTDPEYEAPPIELRLIYVKEEESGSLIEAWNIKRAA
jgi:DNA-binding transcriptional regulator YiaG